MKNGKLRIVEGGGEPSLLKLRRVDNKDEMFDARDQWTLFYSVKADDYKYGSYPVPTGKWVELIDLPSVFARLSEDGMTIIENGPAFQIIRMAPRR